jgi:hypothetical protein
MADSVGEQQPCSEVGEIFVLEWLLKAWFLNLLCTKGVDAKTLLNLLASAVTNDQIKY